MWKEPIKLPPEEVDLALAPRAIKHEQFTQRGTRIVDEDMDFTMLANRVTEMYISKTER